MAYTIGQAAEKMNLTTYTLRYYDKEGLLPFVDRNANGVRVFKEEDFEWLRLIECLKATGMPIKDIKKFFDWWRMGDETLKERRDMFHQRKKVVEQQLEDLQKTLDTINYKCWFYDTAVTEGSLDAVKTKRPEEIPEEIRRLKERI